MLGSSIVRTEKFLGFPLVAAIAMSALVASFPSKLAAQQWANQMFEATVHDFGVVSRNAKAEYAFTFENKLKENLHIASVRSSCGCTKPVVSNPIVKPGERGQIVAQFNTRSFIGQKSAMITVVFDQPYYAEVQLTVTGQIRSDIVTEPGEVQFGDVPVGQERAVSLKISYAGRPDWKILDVRGQSDHLEVRLNQEPAAGNLIAYTMSVKLKETAPAGDMQEEIVVVTNDRQNDKFSLPVKASIRPPISISPAFVSLGSVSAKSAAKDRIIVRGDKPFAITEIVCDDPRIQFQIPKGERPIHVVPFTFTADARTGEFRQQIIVKTNLGQANAGECKILGKVSATAVATDASPTTIVR
jgi:Protein of unknown function (DUF1573)